MNSRLKSPAALVLFAVFGCLALILSGCAKPIPTLAGKKAEWDGFNYQKLGGPTPKNFNVKFSVTGAKKGTPACGRVAFNLQNPTNYYFLELRDSDIEIGRVENGIAEAVKFFHLNALSSPILVKVYFDVVMTMIADTLYSMLAEKLRGFEDCDAPALYRNFVRGKGAVSVRDGRLTVTYPRRAHNPILRRVPWRQLPRTVPAMEGGGELVLRFK